MQLASFFAQRAGVDPSRLAMSNQQLEAIVNERVSQALMQAEVARFEQQKLPHYQQLKPLMGTLLQSGQATSLQDAYTKALQVSPTVASFNAAQRQRAASKRQAVEKFKK